AIAVPFSKIKIARQMKLKHKRIAVKLGFHRGVVFMPLGNSLARYNARTLTRRNNSKTRQVYVNACKREDFFVAVDTFPGRRTHVKAERLQNPTLFDKTLTARRTHKKPHATPPTNLRQY